MSQIVNLTDYEVAPLVNTGVDGQWQATAIVKASYCWNESGEVNPVKPEPVLLADELAGEPASSGLLRASELAPPKPKLDVLLAGALVFPQPVVQTDVELAIGNRLRKRARVFGDRLWVPGMTADLAPSQPRATTRVPIAWERSFGGSDPADARYVEPRNPAGSGVAKDPKTLHGKMAPNFEDPQNLLPVRLGRPAPVGFGPIAAHWRQRSSLAGTYDETWQTKRRPLPPVDFSLAYFNVAAADQQLDGYQPGEEVRLVNLTTAVRDRFRLPALAVPVTFVSTDELSEGEAMVDTLIIEPEERRFSLLARAQTELAEGPMSLARIVVGELTAGMRKALEKGKAYPWDRRRRGTA
jgi:hypothetical protein